METCTKARVWSAETDHLRDKHNYGTFPKGVYGGPFKPGVIAGMIAMMHRPRDGLVREATT
jgi:hypothetical protein